MITKCPWDEGKHVVQAEQIVRCSENKPCGKRVITTGVIPRTWGKTLWRNKNTPRVHEE